MIVAVRFVNFVGIMSFFTAFFIICIILSQRNVKAMYIIMYNNYRMLTMLRIHPTASHLVHATKDC